MQTGKDGGHMKNYVITVAREYGSGGKTIGKMLSEELEIKFYNDELLRLASDESGINEALFAKADENLKKPLILKAPKSVHTGEVIPPESDDFTSDQNLFNYLCKVIRQLADTESCVIVGRCADYILRDYPNVLRLYVHAPFDYCVKKTMEVHPNFDEEEAKRFIRKTDKRRGDYYRYFTGNSWRDADNYDLCLNSSDLGWDKCVALTKAYLEIKLGISL